jgi:hypothetical protein
MRRPGTGVLALLSSLLLLQTQSLLPPAPQGWRTERFALPPDFAPEIEQHGVEDLLFAPGMFAPESDSYFSYVLALRFEGSPEVDERFLADFLEKYYRGLCRAVGEERKLAIDPAKIHAVVHRSSAGFHADVAMFDPFTTGAALDLGLELEVQPGARATEVLGLASPLDHEAPIWDELAKLRELWRAARPAPLLLNHVYLVTDRATFDALAGSEFLRSFAVSEQRETARADVSYNGLYLYGTSTYVSSCPRARRASWSRARAASRSGSSARARARGSPASSRSARCTPSSRRSRAFSRASRCPGSACSVSRCRPRRSTCSWSSTTRASSRAGTPTSRRRTAASHARRCSSATPPRSVARTGAQGLRSRT